MTTHIAAGDILSGRLISSSALLQVFRNKAAVGTETMKLSGFFAHVWQSSVLVTQHLPLFLPLNYLFQQHLAAGWCWQDLIRLSHRCLPTALDGCALGWMSVVNHWTISQTLDPLWESQEKQQNPLDLGLIFEISLTLCIYTYIYKSFNKWLMGEIGVGGCTFPKHGVQPWDVPYPHDLLPPPPTGRVFSRGVAAGLQLELSFVHEGSPSSPHLSS